MTIVSQNVIKEELEEPPRLLPKWLKFLVAYNCCLTTEIGLSRPWQLLHGKVLIHWDGLSPMFNATGLHGKCSQQNQPAQSETCGPKVLIFDSTAEARHDDWHYRCRGTWVQFWGTISGSLRQVQVVLLMEPEPSSKASFCHVSLVESHLSSRLQQSFPVAFLFVKDVIKTSATSWSR